MVEWAKVATGLSVTISTVMVLVTTGIMISIYNDVNMLYNDAMVDMDEFNVSSNNKENNNSTNNNNNLNK